MAAVLVGEGGEAVVRAYRAAGSLVANLLMLVSDFPT